MHSSTFEYILLGGGILFLLSIIAGKVSTKTGVPALLLFLLIGIMAGAEGFGGIEFNDAYKAQSLGIIALIFILFSGGLNTDYREMRPVLGHGILLSTLGLLITAVAVGLFVSYLPGFTFYEGLLLGAIVSSTDAAAVFSILSSSKVSFKTNLKPLLELESGSNDPMAVFLTIGLTFLLTTSNAAPVDLLPMFFLQMIVGGIIGWIMGKASVYFINKFTLEFDGLYPVLTISLIFLTYGLTAFLKGNGFLAVFIMGVIMGKEYFIFKKSVLKFHDGAAWLMQIAMFLTLGLLVLPSEIPAVMGTGMLVSLFLIFIARPLSVFISLAFTRYSFSEKAMISWVGLRGAAPIILATFPLIGGVDKADFMFNVVFFIVITSTIIQGTTIPFMAKLLKIDAPYAKKVKYPLEYEPVEDLKSSLYELEIPFNSVMAGKRLSQISLPSGSLVILINRFGNFMAPNGTTALKMLDRILVWTNEEGYNVLKVLVNTEKELAENPDDMLKRFYNPSKYPGES